jgi:hypothetical protein
MLRRPAFCARAIDPTGKSTMLKAANTSTVRGPAAAPADLT